MALETRTTLANFVNPHTSVAVSETSNPLRDRFSSIWGAHKKDFNVHGYDEKDKAFWTTPEGLQGQSMDTATQVELGVLLTDNFYTQYLAPIEQTDQISKRWDIIKFAPTLPTVVPERGRVRIVKSSLDSRQESLQRFGIGLEFLYGFLDTPLGEFMYQMAKQQLQIAVVEGMAFGVMQVFHCVLFFLLT
jgi:hypothetical protein